MSTRERSRSSILRRRVTTSRWWCIDCYIARVSTIVERRGSSCSLLYSVLDSTVARSATLWIRVVARGTWSDIGVEHPAKTNAPIAGDMRILALFLVYVVYMIAALHVTWYPKNGRSLAPRFHKNTSFLFALCQSSGGESYSPVLLA